jgi:hypothetical protein
VPEILASTEREEQLTNSPFEIADGVVVHPASKRTDTVMARIFFI